MKIAIFNHNRLGIVQHQKVVDVTEVAQWNPEHPSASFLQLMETFETQKPELQKAADQGQGQELSEVTFQSPVPSTNKIWAAPVNYKKHQDEMNKQFNNAPRTAADIKLFLKSPSSLSGPAEPIRLPFKERRTDHEAELGYVVGKKAKNVHSSDAKEYIFGYFALLDISIRGEEERPWRKSFDTFTPIGPWIVTADEIEDPNQLDLKLWVNDEIRQEGNTKHLIYDSFKCFEAATQNMTLHPGDIMATGTPEGVGPINEGDKVRIHVESVGEFTVDVVADYNEYLDKG
ncbi:FAA hydrolase family protein [Salibacterium salarium]|uniref:FAA hydrolase family protein n=1 Tax=Salibacterium salarium TaxID=284579 RepID=A0A428N1W1_9BACI|nr:fumarylacetoacetate hydrolase family protein [Salibacterium salarium]RSL32336.1 FAA hydrolase family protein [Salibacterium salarium]